MPEKDLYKPIWEYLKLHHNDWIWWRQNVGARGHVKFGQKGRPDIEMLVPPLGMYFGLELKSAHGRLSEDQQVWAERVDKVGGAVYLIWDWIVFEDVIARIEMRAAEAEAMYNVHFK